MIDQFLIASEFQIKFAWTCLYFFVVYIFYNVIYYYENNDEDRLSFEVFDWDPEPGKACLWVFLILAFFIPGFAAFHFFIYRCVLCCAVLCVCMHVCVSCGRAPPKRVAAASFGWVSCLVCCFFVCRVWHGSTRKAKKGRKEGRGLRCVVVSFSR